MQKSANLFDVKDRNRKLVLDLLRRSPRSRADLATASGLTRQAISLIADQLLSEKLIVETGRLRGSVGRSPTLLEIHPAGGYIAGINLTRIHANIGITDLCGSVLEQRVIETGGTAPHRCLEEITAILHGQLASVPAGRLLGVGVSAPGPLDYRSGVICNPPAFPGWRDIPVAQILREALEQPVRVENVADAMALEELYFGACRECANFMVIIVDEEIGAGIVVDSELYRGRAGFGGEIGHISIAFDGLECECGNRGCLSRYASVPEILRDSSYADWNGLVDAADTDPQALECVKQEAGYLSAAMVTAVNLLDLEAVLIGGHLSHRPQLLLDHINELLGRRVITHAARNGPLASITENCGGVRTAVMPVVADFYTNSLWR